MRPRQPFGFADWNRFETEIPKKAICAGPHWSPSAWAWWSTEESCRARGRGRTWARLSIRHVPCYQSLSSIYFDLEFILFYVHMLLQTIMTIMLLVYNLFILWSASEFLIFTAPFGSDGRSWGWPCWWRDLRRGDRRTCWQRLGVCPSFWGGALRPSRRKTVRTQGDGRLTWLKVE